MSYTVSINVSDVKVAYVHRCLHTKRAHTQNPRIWRHEQKKIEGEEHLSSGATAEWSDAAELETQRVELTKRK